VLVGAAVAMAAPCGWRTQPNSPCSVSIPSISEKTEETRIEVQRAALAFRARAVAAPAGGDEREGRVHPGEVVADGNAAARRRNSL
jgi:hypothetical protein